MNKNLLIILAFLLFNIGYGQKTWTGATSTAWDLDSNWSPVGKPTSTENVLITNSANQPVISVTGASCATLTLSNSTAGTAVTLTIKTSTNGTFSPVSIIMNSNGGNTSVCSLNINTGRVVTGNVTMNAIQNNVTFSDDGTLFVGGIMTGGTLNANDKGTVNYNGSGIRDVGTYSYNDLTISGSGTRTISSGVIVNGTFTMGGSAKSSSAPTYGANASLLYNSTSALTVGPEWVSPFTATGGIEISNPTLDPGASVVTINDGSKKVLGEGVPLVIDEEAALVTNSDIYLEGDFINNRGSLRTDGYVYLAGNKNQSIDSFTAAKGVIMNKTGGTATFTEDITSKELIINGQGRLNLGIGRTHAFTDWTRTQGTLDGGSSTLKFSGNVIGEGGDFIAGTSTVEFNGGVQNLGSGSITYNNLVLSGTGTKTFGAKTTINETISIMSGVVADLTTNLVHTAKSIKLGTAAGDGGSWGNALSNAVNKNNTYFASNNGIINVGPTIAINTDTLSGLTSIYGTPSASNSFTISGIAMVDGILVTAPTGFEISTDGTIFSNTLTIGASGTIASTTVYVRLKGTIPVKDYSGNIVLKSNDTTIINIAIARSTVNKAPLTIKADNKEINYGADIPVLTASYDKLVNGDTPVSLGASFKIATDAVKGSIARDYDITVSGADSSNYDITYGSKGILTINKVALIITTNSDSRAYGSENPVLTASYVGFVNGDTVASLGTSFKIETNAKKESPVQGEYKITASGADSSNYTFDYKQTGILTIDPVVLTITTNDASRAYGSENPVLTASYVGFVNGDTVASLGTSFKIETNAKKESPVEGEYKITASGADSSNYTFDYKQTGILTIDPVVLTITTNDASRAYGSENPVLTASYVGFVNGDTVASLGTSFKIETNAKKESPVEGEYKITASGAVSPNYEISYGKPNGFLTITPVKLTITADRITKTHGEKNPELTVKYEGFVLTDTKEKLDSKVAINTEATTDSAIGEYLITVSGATSKNYSIKFVAGILDVVASKNANLSDIVLSDGATLDKPFDPANLGYTVEVPNETNSIVINPLPSNPNATVEMIVDSKTVDPSNPIDLKVGDNKITIVVTAEDGSTTKTYEVIVVREPSSNAGLKDILLSDGAALDKPFDPAKLGYTVEVPNETNSIVVTPVTIDPNAKVVMKVDEVIVDPTSPIDLKVGDNKVTIEVLAEDGSTKETYTVIITREEAVPSSNAGLADIVLSDDAALSPAFNTDTNDYRVEVPNETNSIVITPITIDPNATVEMIVDGKVIDPTSPIDLKVGDNTITIVVTAPDSSTNTYDVIVNRADAEPQVIVPTNIITPNGDGKNDYWIVPGIEKYPNNSVKVFDRAARLVYSRDHYSNDWDGTYKGSPLTQDTYYYLIDLGAGQPKIKGFISIIRD